MASRPDLSTAAGPAKPARFVLRDGTRDEHDRVDDAFSHFDLNTEPGYADFLAAHYLAHREIESWLALADLPSELRLAERTPLIAADLADLGHKVPEQTLPTPMPGSPGLSSWAGVLYCVAGSTFGARVLLQRIPQDAPRRFLSQPLPAGYWQRLVDFLDTVARRGALPTTFAAARRTFSVFVKSADRVAEGRA